jgi:hypothetical protein
MNQGTVATLWHGIQASLLQSVLVHVPLLPGNANLLTVYHVGMLVDELVLLTGTWLLARRFFGTPTVMFITLSVVGTTVWLDQPYWNFRLHYAIPLIVELGHRFLDTGRWRWAFLTLNLLAVQMLGNLPYLIPVTSFVVAAYFAAYAAANLPVVLPQLAGIRWGWRAIVAVAGGVLSLWMAYLCFTVGTESLVSYNAYRNADGTNSLSVFLTYGKAVFPSWIDMALNLSPWIDMTLYSGILVLPLLVLAIFVMDRRRIHLLIAGCALLLFTQRTFVSTTLFYVWPGMKYFRHIGMVSPLVRIFWCFAAGVGFEWVCESPSETRGRSQLLGAALAAALLGLIALGATWLSANHTAMMTLVNTISNPGFFRPAHTQLIAALSQRLRISAQFAAVGALLVASGPIAVAVPSISWNLRTRQARIWALLLLVFVDVYHFKFAYLFERSDVTPASALLADRPTPMPYPVRRDIDLKTAAITGSNSRLNATLAFSPMFRARLQGRSSIGAQYWTNNLFLFADEAGSTFQVDSWLKPLDQLMRMYWRVPINDTSGFPPGVDLTSFVFPSSHPAIARIAGITEDKIRFFSRAHMVGSVDVLPSLMTDNRYGGNLLFLLPPSEPDGARPSAVNWNGQESLSDDESQPLAYHVDQFDANNVRVSIPNAGSARWMYYADVWHPFWRATVNGRPVPVYRANMAYKAVPIEAGENVVRLTFGSPLLSALSALHALDAAFWLAMVAALAIGGC